MVVVVVVVVGVIGGLAGWQFGQMPEWPVKNGPVCGQSGLVWLGDFFSFNAVMAEARVVVKKGGVGGGRTKKIQPNDSRVTDSRASQFTATESPSCG